MNSYSDYPLGTKAYSSGGGYWERVARGWQWCTGKAIFPTPGGDVAKIELPCQKITWTNCAERMPPDDNTEIIVLSSADGEYHKLTGAFLNGPLQKKYGVRLAEELWTLYTPEKWKELNK